MTAARNTTAVACCGRRSGAPVVSGTTTQRWQSLMRCDAVHWCALIESLNNDDHDNDDDNYDTAATTAAAAAAAADDDDDDADAVV